MQKSNKRGKNSVHKFLSFAAFSAIFIIGALLITHVTNSNVMQKLLFQWKIQWISQTSFRWQQQKLNKLHISVDLPQEMSLSQHNPLAYPRDPELKIAYQASLSNANQTEQATFSFIRNFGYPEEWMINCLQKLNAHPSDTSDIYWVTCDGMKNIYLIHTPVNNFMLRVETSSQSPEIPAFTEKILSTVESIPLKPPKYTVLLTKDEYTSEPVDTKNWQKLRYFYPYENAEFELAIPPHWVVKKTSDEFGLDHIFVGTESASLKNSLIGYSIGDGLVYSTSGSLCGTTNCSEIGNISVTIEGKPYSTPIILNTSFQHRFAFYYQRNPGETTTITSTFSSDEELQTILNSIAKIKRIR